jgi:hypothetical protein
LCKWLICIKIDYAKKYNTLTYQGDRAMLGSNPST